MLPSVLLSVLLAVAPPACASSASGLKPLLDEIELERDLDTEHPATDPRLQFMVYADDAQMAQRVLAVALKHRARAQQFFGTSIIWKEPALILVYPTLMSYYRSWGMFGTAGVQVQFRYKGTKVKLIVTYEGKRLLEHTLPHELMHLLMYDMSNRHYFEGRRRDPVHMPMWIQEGLAEYMTAGTERRQDYEKLVYWALHEKKEIPLRRLLVLMGYDRRVLLHYAEAYSFVAFLAASAGDGRIRLRNYITSFNEPTLAKEPLKVFEMAFQGVVPSLDVLEQRWHAWAARSYQHHFSPVIVKTKPAAKATGAPLDGRIWVKFDKPVDPDTLKARTIALRRGASTKLGTDKGNLLRRAEFRYDAGTCVLLIEVPGGLKPGRTYTLALSDGVKDNHAHGLVAEKFDEMKRADWWTSDNPEPRPDEKEKDKKKTPPKLVTSISFTTRKKESDSGDAHR